jgi:hypothetical protein
MGVDMNGGNAECVGMIVALCCESRLQQYRESSHCEGR